MNLPVVWGPAPTPASGVIKVTWMRAGAPADGAAERSTSYVNDPSHLTCLQSAAPPAGAHTHCSGWSPVRRGSSSGFSSALRAAAFGGRAQLSTGMKLAGVHARVPGGKPAVRAPITVLPSPPVVSPSLQLSTWFWISTHTRWVGFIYKEKYNLMFKSSLRQDLMEMMAPMWFSPGWAMILEWVFVQIILKMIKMNIFILKKISLKHLSGHPGAVNHQLSSWVFSGRRLITPLPQVSLITLIQDPDRSKTYFFFFFISHLASIMGSPSMTSPRASTTPSSRRSLESVLVLGSPWVRKKEAVEGSNRVCEIYVMLGHLDEEQQMLPNKCEDITSVLDG